MVLPFLAVRLVCLGRLRSQDSIASVTVHLDTERSEVRLSRASETLPRAVLFGPAEDCLPRGEPHVLGDGLGPGDLG